MLKIGDWYYVPYSHFYELGVVVKIHDNPNYCDVERYFVDSETVLSDYQKTVQFDYLTEVDSVAIQAYLDNTKKPSDAFVLLYRDQAFVDKINNITESEDLIFD
jgi:hypothetical protein